MVMKRYPLQDEQMSDAEITEDIRRVAGKMAGSLNLAVSDQLRVAEVVSNAILGERLRCAAVAERHELNNPNVPLSRNSYWEGASDASESIANAIRVSANVVTTAHKGGASEQEADA